MDQETVDLLRAAEQILIDIDDWDEISRDSDNEYGPTTTIGILRAAVVAKRRKG